MMRLLHSAALCAVATICVAVGVVFGPGARGASAGIRSLRLLDRRDA